MIAFANCQGGKLSIGEPFIHESVLQTKVGSYQAIIPQITGNAYITGFNQLVIDPDDPLKYGFQLKK